MKNKFITVTERGHEDSPVKYKLIDESVEIVCQGEKSRGVLLEEYATWDEGTWQLVLDGFAKKVVIPYDELYSKISVTNVSDD